MKTTIETLRSGLASQLAELDRELEAANEQVIQLKSSRRQVAAAIKALGDRDASAEPTSPAPKKLQVREAIEKLLADNGGAIITEDLEPLVAEKIATDYGCSAMGLALRMREVLTSDEFSVIDGRVQKCRGKTVAQARTENI